jgi:2-phospho-L-lactate guanylyltransferase
MRSRAPQVEHLHAIVPVNVISKSKERLSPLLRPAERADLSILMLKNVLSALRRSKRIDSLAVVSADTSLRIIARKYQVRFLWEGKRRGLNKGLRLAIARAELDGASSVLIMHADLPLLTSSEIDEFLRASHGYQVAIAPSKDGEGTNALLLNSPFTIRPMFGKNSFKKHWSQAKKRNLRCKILRCPKISFDVDEPEDVLSLARLKRRNASAEFLRMIGVNSYHS